MIATPAWESAGGITARRQLELPCPLLPLIIDFSPLYALLLILDLADNTNSSKGDGTYYWSTELWEPRHRLLVTLTTPILEQDHPHDLCELNEHLEGERVHDVMHLDGACEQW